MTEREARRIYREATPEERERLDRYREQVDQELPEILERAKKREAAISEPTFSGQLRRAIAESGLLYPEISERSGIPLIELDEFMTGERVLNTDEVDRLTGVLGVEFQAVK